MKGLLLLCFVAVCAGYFNHELIHHVNEGEHGWKAGENEYFRGWDLKGIMERVTPCKAQVAWQRRNDTMEGAPASFDSRKAWPKCASMRQIRNQAECGSCWAFGCVESVTDRYCVAAKQMQNPILSAEYLVSCDSGSAGCFGGSPDQAWNWVEQNGLPTVQCQPYTVPTCKPSQQPCTNFQPTPRCQQKCTGKNPGNSTFNNRYYVSRVYNPKGGMFGSLKKMMEDIQANGPVEVAFSVYEDFIHYKSGVYKHTSGRLLGGHAVKLIGWGTEGGQAYWLCSNSWTTQWGDAGYFKIARGVNECGIEDGPVAGTPKVH
eukprot:TRINITY_DN85301_c0_g1_i1.p1 TRINITY_DN85301_c0_g1~~TRINITY_DN85301_c0_g1_i1.p1  ORF type:complete len:324 (-),score=58.85 TRINITY_DN85301_c0_g1_i1:113-1063(-)